MGQYSEAFGELDRLHRLSTRTAKETANYEAGQRHLMMLIGMSYDEVTSSEYSERSWSERLGMVLDKLMQAHIGNTKKATIVSYATRWVTLSYIAQNVY